MTANNVAIIGGTGVYSQSFLENPREITVETRYGDALLTRGKYKEREVYFLARHGKSHHVPPHRVNYRANIAALRKLGVTDVISTAAVGSMRQAMFPGSRVLIDQFIDWTKDRVSTFFEGDGCQVVHVDFSEPYCPEMRRSILKAGEKLEQDLINGGCYVCAEGPRFETPAEVKMMAQWGGDLVGMTNVPEVTLAREAGLCYATICLVTCYAAGISTASLSHEEVLEEMAKGKESLDRLLAACIDEISELRACSCSATAAVWDEMGV